MSQESKSIAAAKKLLAQNGYSPDRSDYFVRVTLRSYFPILRNTNHGAKFILGTTRLFLNNDFEKANSINVFNNVLKYIASDAHIDEYNRNFNGDGFQRLIGRFAQNITEDLEADKKELSEIKFTPNDNYKIVPINSFEESSKYGQYTSWCITHYEDMFDSYTNDSINQFYFCFRNEFEIEKAVEGENCPLDSYGLSMIAICVDENGALKTCTCRWNHDNGGSDSIMTTKQISEIIGGNFYEVFKPNNKWKNALEKAAKKLKAGIDLKKIFDNVWDSDGEYTIVKLGKKWNFINKNREFLTKEWFKLVSLDLKNENAIVELNNRYNFMNIINGKLLTKEWFDWVFTFVHGFATVVKENKYNFIDTKGKIISPNQWFDDSSDYENGFAEVKINGKWHFIDENGNLIYNQILDESVCQTL